MYQITAQGVDQIREEAAVLFRNAFHREATAIVLAPGRVNLIGEHVDYNDGIVLPFALDLHTAVAIAPSPTPIVRLISASDQRLREYSSREPNALPWEGWTRYIQGVWHYWSRGGENQTPGFDLAVSSSLPVGAGLSSSAALCVAALLALEKIAPAQFTEWQGPQSVLERATLCQQVEHHFAGVRCGLMDQLASLACRSGQLLAVDFCGPTLTQIRWPDPDLACLLVHTGVQHQLASSEYGKRRAECESAARKLGLRSLRDCDPGELERAPRSDALPSSSLATHGSAPPPPLTTTEYLRARHVVSEIRRSLQAIDACQAGDATELGALMNSSHQSLREDYAVSCKELDYLVDETRGLPGVLGSRMTGGGFGGSMIALIDPRGDWRGSLEQLLQTYQRRFGLIPRWLPCRPSSGALELASSLPPCRAGEG